VVGSANAARENVVADERVAGGDGR